MLSNVAPVQALVHPVKITQSTWHKMSENMYVMGREYTIGGDYVNGIQVLMGRANDVLLMQGWVYVCMCVGGGCMLVNEGEKEGRKRM